MTMDSFVKAPAASLPDGWEWHCWGDGSGSLQAPDGRSFFRYDCIPYANSGEIEYYADMESGAIEHGTVHIAAYKNGHLESFSVNFDNGDFDEFVGSGFGTHFFRTEAEASTCVKQGNKN